MYVVKPIVEKFEINVESNMYPVKRICELTIVSHNNPYPITTSKTLLDISQQIKNVLKNDDNSSSDLQMLESRQQEIIDKLMECMKKLSYCKSDLKICAKPAQMFASNKEQIILPVAINLESLQDMIINVNPKNIPYSLLSIKLLWKKRLGLNVTCYKHSNVKVLSDEAEQFQDKITVNSPHEPTVNITLIWKNVDVTEMKCESILFAPIYGEVNILRYLSRIGPSEFNYELYRECNAIDSILDICYNLDRSRTVKERQTILRNLNNILMKNSYIVGSKLTLADIGVYSTIKQLTMKDVLKTTIKWLDNIEHEIHN